MENFSYRVREAYHKLNDNQCCYQMSDAGGWHFYRCPRKVTKRIDGVGLCGTHARSVEAWRKH